MNRMGSKYISGQLYNVEEIISYWVDTVYLLWSVTCIRVLECTVRSAHLRHLLIYLSFSINSSGFLEIIDARKLVRHNFGDELSRSATVLPDPFFSFRGRFMILILFHFRIWSNSCWWVYRWIVARRKKLWCNYASHTGHLLLLNFCQSFKENSG